MNETIRKFKGVLRFCWQDYLEYRGYLVYWAILESLPFLVMFFLWQYIYIGRENVNGYDLSAMITYYFLVYYVKQLTTNYFDWGISNKINKGYFADFLYKPIGHRLYYVGNNLAGKTIRFMVSLPVIIVMTTLLYRYLELPAADSFVYFLLAVILAAVLNMYVSYLAGYFAFWMEKADSVLYFKDTFIYYLSGSMIPLSFFGESLSGILNILPFRYLVSFPIEIYLGKVGGTSLMQGFFCATLWLIVFLVLERVVYKRGIKKFSAVGN